MWAWLGSRRSGSGRGCQRLTFWLGAFTPAARGNSSSCLSRLEIDRKMRLPLINGPGNRRHKRTHGRTGGRMEKHVYYLSLSAARCFCRCLCCCCCCCCVGRCHAKNFACCCCCCDNETKAKTAATVSDFLWLSHSELFATLLAACAEIPCAAHMWGTLDRAGRAGTCINLLVEHFLRCSLATTMLPCATEICNSQAGSRQAEQAVAVAGSRCGIRCSAMWRGAATPAAAKGSCQFILHFP